MLLLPDWAVSPRIHNDTVLTIIWAIAALGALLKLVLARRFETPGLILYVALGCAVVSFTHAVLDGFAGHWRLLLEFLKSGACYLGGLVFYLDDDIPQSNALWCVLCVHARAHPAHAHHLPTRNAGTPASWRARCCTRALSTTSSPWATSATRCPEAPDIIKYITVSAA